MYAYFEVAIYKEQVLLMIIWYDMILVAAASMIKKYRRQYWAVVCVLPGITMIKTDYHIKQWSYCGRSISYFLRPELIERFFLDQNNWFLDT